MRPYEIENWALRIIERVRSGQPFEDARVELKSEWPDPKKAARQIAAHANASRGESILWLIGVDQQKGLVGARYEELANWFPAVKAEFDELAPSLTDLNIPIEGFTVVALLFEAGRVPFVVKNPTFGTHGGGPVEREVPWREGGSTRSARRSELLRLLSTVSELPSLEVLSARSWFEAASAGQGETPLHGYWAFESRAYIVPSAETRIIIPFHRCKGSFEISGIRDLTPFDRIWLGPPESFSIPSGYSIQSEKPSSYTIAGTPTEVIIEGPGMLRIHASAKTPFSESRDMAGDAKVYIDLLPVDSDRAIKIEVVLRHNLSERGTTWTLESGR